MKLTELNNYQSRENYTHSPIKTWNFLLHIWPINPAAAAQTLEVIIILKSLILQNKNKKMFLGSCAPGYYAEHHGPAMPSSCIMYVCHKFYTDERVVLYTHVRICNLTIYSLSLYLYCDSAFPPDWRLSGRVQPTMFTLTRLPAPCWGGVGSVINGHVYPLGDGGV